MMDDTNNPTFPADTIGIILIVINVLPFMHFIFSCIQLVRNGPGADIKSGSVDTFKSLEKNRPNNRRLTRTSTLTLVNKAVHHDKAVKIHDNHNESRDAAIKKIKHREQKADARVRQRLAERRKKKLKVERKAQHLAKIQKTTNVVNIKLWQVHAAPTVSDNETEAYALEVQTFRTKLVKKIKSPKKLMALFKKLDKDNNNLLSKKEFRKLVKALVKPEPVQEVITAVWEDARLLRKNGQDIEELDYSTLCSWAFGTCTG